MPRPKDACLEALQKRIRISQQKRECTEQGIDYEPEESVPIAPMLDGADPEATNKLNSGPGRVHNFDL